MTKELSAKKAAQNTHETLTPHRALMQSLSGLYDSNNYAQIMPNFTGRSGTAGVLVTNENLDEETTQLSPAPSGYIIGVGNGAIWMMLDLFQPRVLPKGIISLDYDPNVILSGKLLVEFANRGISPEEAVSYLFGAGNVSLQQSVNQVVDVARSVVAREQNLQFKQVLLNTINNGEFVDDMRLTRTLEKKERLPDLRRRRNVTETIYRYWNTITDLAQQGNIFFAHSDVADEFTLSFIESSIPEIGSLQNILYTSNLVDSRYKHELNGWQRFNPEGKSWYVFTTQYRDNYVLRASHEPPVFPGLS